MNTAPDSSESLGEIHTASTGNGRMRYYLRGERSELPDIVLEHGGGGTAGHWAKLVPLLAEHGRVYCYDRAGAGDSPRDGLGSSAEVTTQRLAQLVEQAQVRKPFVLAGYSLGGLYAQHYAARHPQDVLGLVLVDPTPANYPVAAWRRRMVGYLIWLLHWLARSGLVMLWWKITGKKIDAELRRGYEHFSSPGYLASFREEQTAIAGLAADVMRVAPQLAHPALALIAGNRAGMRADLAAHLRELHLGLMKGAPAGSRMVEIEQAEHGSILKDAASVDRCAEQTLAFMRSLAR